MIKRRLFEIINDDDPYGSPNHLFDYFIISLILLNLVVIFLETYRSIYLAYHIFFNYFEIFSIGIFTIEYLIRIWTCTEYPEYQHQIYGRIRYALSFSLLVDLLSFLPFYLTLFLPFDQRIVKLFRLLRLVRIFKLLRYYGSTDVIIEVLQKNKDYLVATGTILLFFLIFASYSIFIVESTAQPFKYKDIGSSFWWAVVTLTTVGYGDIYPITMIGKALTIIILIIGIGIIALPTGIIASGFLEVMRARKEVDFPEKKLSIAEEMRQIYSLKLEGIITDEEFVSLKERLMNQYKRKE